MKRVLIEIPDEFENDLKDKFNDFFNQIKADLEDWSETLLCGKYETGTIDMFLKSFDSAKVISEMTNEDVIEAIFPNCEQKEHMNNGYFEMYFDNDLENASYMRISKDFWRAKYESEGE